MPALWGRPERAGPFPGSPRLIRKRRALCRPGARESAPPAGGHFFSFLLKISRNCAPSPKVRATNTTDRLVATHSPDTTKLRPIQRKAKKYRSAYSAYLARIPDGDPRAHTRYSAGIGIASSRHLAFNTHRFSY